MSEIGFVTARPVSIRLNRKASSLVRRGHPWVYAGGLERCRESADSNGLGVLYDEKNDFLGVGLYDPKSPIIVRLVSRERGVAIDSTYWRVRLAEALSRRTSDVIGGETNGYRIINGESDGWPGLVFDRYGDVGVIKIYVPFWATQAEQLRELFATLPWVNSLVLRYSGKAEEPAKRAGLEQGMILQGKDCGEQAVFLESGIRFEANVIQGQKTGFFLDQRENRRRVRDMASGASVCNLFSFSGAFSLYAARGGAKRLLDVDISQHALTSARRNRELNDSLTPIAEASFRYQKADAFQWIAGEREVYDLMIVDPPSFARKAADVPKAISAYRFLAKSAAKRVSKNGLLVLASCSAHISTAAFVEAVGEEVKRCWGNMQIVTQSEHAPDHPATFNEAKYLKCLFLRRS